LLLPLLLSHVAAAAAASLLPVLLLQAVDAYIGRMRYVPTASTDAVLGLFWDTIIKYHMLSRWGAVIYHV
jgi:hypothetical protein